MKRSARDLGTWTLAGRSVHGYEFTSSHAPEMLYVGSNGLAVQSVVQKKEETTTIVYSNYNVPVTIEP